MSTKTLAIRLDPDLHARISILARLSDISVTEAIRDAIEKHVETLATDPALIARATDLQGQIKRDADEQQAAIQALFGADAGTSATSTTRSRKA